MAKFVKVASSFEELRFLTPAVMADVTGVEPTEGAVIQGASVVYDGTVKTESHFFHETEGEDAPILVVESEDVSSLEELRKDERKEGVRQWMFSKYWEGVDYVISSATSFVEVEAVKYVPEGTVNKKVRAYARKMGYDIEAETSRKSKLLVTVRDQEGRKYIFNLLNELHEFVGYGNSNREQILQRTAPWKLTIVNGKPERESVRRWFLSAGLPARAA